MMVMYDELHRDDSTPAVLDPFVLDLVSGGWLTGTDNSMNVAIISLTDDELSLMGHRDCPAGGGECDGEVTMEAFNFMPWGDFPSTTGGYA